MPNLFSNRFCLICASVLFVVKVLSLVMPLPSELSLSNVLVQLFFFCGCFPRHFLLPESSVAVSKERKAEELVHWTASLQSRNKSIGGLNGMYK